MTSFLSGAGKSQRAGSLQLWRFCCCVWSARIVFNRSRVCERSFLSFSVSRLFSAYNLWKLPANMAERFVTFDIREVEKFIDNEENSNTRKKTKNDMLYWVLSWQRKRRIDKLKRYLHKNWTIVWADSYFLWERRTEMSTSLQLYVAL